MLLTIIVYFLIYLYHILYSINFKINVLVYQIRVESDTYIIFVYHGL